MDGEATVSDDRGLKLAGTRRVAPPSRRVMFDLSSVTPGERLWLWRHAIPSLAGSRRGVAVRTAYSDASRPVASNQMEAAWRLKMDTSAYWAAEKDMLPPARLLELLDQVDEPPYELKDALRIARRRSPLTLPAVALGTGVGSRPTFYKLEAAGDERVAAFWQRQGFRFPRKFPIYFKGI
jgi:hypothetical protein